MIVARDDSHRRRDATQPIRAARRIERLYVDSIGQAQRSIYVENQYTSSEVIADALAARLEDPQGPEVIIVCPRSAHGWLERSTIDRLRGQFLERLRQANRADRLRFFHPTSGDDDSYVHAKVMIIDDTCASVHRT